MYRTNAVNLLATLLAAMCFGQEPQPKPQPATAALIAAFNQHDTVLFGEYHGCKQEYDWLNSLVAAPAFADRVDDIVVESGNSLYQRSVDRYIAGEDVPFSQVRLAWRNLAGAVGPPSPVYENFFKAVREVNLKRRGKHQMRIVLGDPYVDWDAIKDREDLGPFVANRDSWYAQVVKDEVIAKHHRALLIMGWGHFLRRGGPGAIEKQLRAAGAQTYLVVFGTNAVGSYDDLDKRFDSFAVPSIVELNGTWVGNLPALPVLMGGIAPSTPLKLADAADALLYAGPRDHLTELRMSKSELDGTPYGKEMDRRIMIQTGRTIPLFHDADEGPLFQRPRPPTGPPPPLPPPPKSFHDPLPARPPSR